MRHLQAGHARGKLVLTMTDAYPPFRLDQGGADAPVPGPDDLAPASAARAPAPATPVG